MGDALSWEGVSPKRASTTSHEARGLKPQRWPHAMVQNVLVEGDSQGRAETQSGQGASEFCLERVISLNLCS